MRGACFSYVRRLPCRKSLSPPAGRKSLRDRSGVETVSLVREFLTSPIGRKALMAVTGLLLIGFLVVHLSGNLLVFAGPEPFNAYSHKLVSNPLIYLAEAVLLVLFAVHLGNGIVLFLRNRAARPVGYAVQKWAGEPSHKTLASTTMIYTGLVVLAFVPLHLWTFKFGPHYASSADPAVRDLYRLVIEEFHEPGEVIWYAFAMIVIGFHLWHGFGSAFESLGVRYSKWLRRFGEALAVGLAGGFLLIPVLIFFLGEQP